MWHLFDHEMERFALGTLLLTACCAQPILGPDPQATERPPVTAVTRAEPPLLLREGHPQRYTVQIEDSVWEISETYLDQPWRWNELWQPEAVGQVIFPGDVLEIDGSDTPQPRLQRIEGERPTLKLSPRVRVDYIEQPVPTIPREAISSFLDESVVFTQADWKGAPYVIGAADGRNLIVDGDAIIARGSSFDSPRYGVFRPRGELRHPDTGAFLGFDMMQVGEAALETEGDPATLRVLSARREIRAGDRLIETRDLDSPPQVFDFTPVAAPPDSFGYVLGVQGRDSLTISRYDTVLISLGNLDGMKQGSVLAVFRKAATLTDPLTGATVDSGQERVGLVMLYKVFDRVSYGVVTEAQRSIRPLDPVREPS